jgi:putative ABC transport system substrate-binding protein
MSRPLLAVTLLLAGTLLAPATAPAGTVAVLLTADVDAYREAVRGLKASLKGHRVVAEYDMEGDLGRGRKQLAEIHGKVRPDLLVVVGVWALQVAVEQPPPVPVVYAMVLNPQSIVGSARNVTGASMNVPVDQALRVLRQLGPQVKRVGLISDRAKTGFLVRAAEPVARELGLQLVAREVRSPREAVPALDALQEEGIDALWVLPDESNLAPAVVQHMLLVSYRRRIPLVGLSDSQAQSGALLALSFASSEDIGRQAGEQANAILGGRPPAEVPHAAARQVRLTVNLKAAQKLGVEVPKSVLALATNVIQ